VEVAWSEEFHRWVECGESFNCLRDVPIRNKLLSHSEHRSSEPATGVPGVRAREDSPRWGSLAGWLPWSILLVGLGLSIWMYLFLCIEYERADRVHFDHLSRAAESDIAQGVSVCANALRAGQAFFNATPSMTREHWKAFAETQDMPNRYPGVRGLGVVFAVAPSKITEFAAGIRADGRPDFVVREIPGQAPLIGQGSEYPFYVITYMEPETAVDAPVFGMNIASERGRREAAERARDTGSPVLSGLLYLLTDSSKRSAFALYEPFYHVGMPTKTVEQRRQAIRGWIYARLVMEDFLGSITSGMEFKELELCFYAGDSTTPENLVFAIDRSHVGKQDFERREKLELAGRTFTLGWTRSPHFVSSATSAPLWAGVFSAAVAIFLAALVGWLLSSKRRTTETLARQDAELAYQKFALDQHAIVAITNAEGEITYANDKFCAISGYSRQELIGQNHRIIKSGVHPPEFFQQLYATVTKGKVWHGEVCNRNKNGTLCWMSATIVPFLGPDGRPQRFVAIRSDITALKVAEEHIRQSQDRLASIFNALDEGVLLQESETQILESNAAAERILGLTNAQICGREPVPSWWQMVDQGGAPMPMEKRPTAITFRTGKAIRGSILGLKKPNGSITWISVNNEPIRDSVGTVRAVVSSFVDISEQRWAENALHEAAQRIHLAAAIAEIGIWDWDLATNRVLADDRMFEIYGLPRTADGYLPFEFWKTVMLPEDLPSQMLHLSQTIESSGQSRRHFRIRRISDGHLRYIESQEQVQTDHAGKAVRVIGVNRDITEMVQAETSLLESEARTRLFAEHAPVSVAMFDREMRYLVASKQWMADYKLVGSSILGRSHYEVFPDVHERWKEIHRRCLGGEVETALADSIVREDGSVQWLQWEVRPWYASDGAIGGIVMFTLDITQRCELEARLEKARDDALAASRLKSEFLATMSHEIRTPMNGVIGMASLLMQTPLEGRQREMAQALVNSAERLLVIINDILDFSKIESGKMRIESVDFELRDLIEETAALIAASAHGKKLHFTCDIAPALATGFSGDTGRLQQVLANLLGNAVKFTHEGSVALKADVLHMTDSSATFRIEITDTGVGIPAAARDSLFQPFVQADGSTTRRFGGTGLGLAICNQLVSLMGGRIGFESTLGQGSTFWVELCLPRVELPGAAAPEQIPPEARVLVVDGHDVSRMVLQRQLSTLKVAAEVVASAEEALAMLERDAGGSHPFNIVLLDYDLPGMDGMAFARTIRANPTMSGVCLIALSTTGETIEPGLASELKLHAVLTKPIRDRQLQRCLLRVFGRRATPKPFSARRQTLSGRGLKLLLAEDNATNQLVAQLMLEQLGHTIEIAENGHAVLEWLTAEPFDAVLMDCQMPELDGYEATRMIRAGRVRGASPSIPIIALTAYAMPADRTRVMEAGMDDYVTKPLSIETLHAALSRCGLVDSSRKIAEVITPVQRTEPEVPVFDPIQRTKLQAIPTPGGGTVWDKALGVFMKEMPGRLAALTEHTNGQRSEPLAAMAHTIAGSAASLGAPALRAAGLALEVAARANDWNRIPALHAVMQNAWRMLEPKLLNTVKT